MKTEIVNITPDLAKSWLMNNATCQRKVRQSIVDRYARDMLNGSWTLTHQGVAFDVNDHLIDGQHRLHAIIQSGVTIPMMVVRRAPNAAFNHVDLGFARTTADILKAHGEGWITEDRIAMARFIECNDKQTSISVNRSPFELSEMVKLHKNAIDFVLQNMERKVKNITIAPVLAAVAVAYYNESDRLALANFVKLLVNGVSENSDRDFAVIRLRDWLRDIAGKTSFAMRYEVFLKTQRVIKAFIRNEKLVKLIAPSESIYKLPIRYSYDQHP